MNCKKTAALLLILSLSLFIPLFDQPEVEAQSSTNLSLTFHAYSVVLRDPNGSLVAYDGADGAAPLKSTAEQATINAQITGSRSGFTTYSAMAVWVAQLPYDLHVSGKVTIRAYISSTYKPSFLSGAGYGMGLVDFDENNNDIKEFIVEGPQSIGSSPFSSTPTAFSLSTNIDYVFKKGHAIGFFVGVGSTDKGFTATVHFDSADRASGATLPVVQFTQTQSVQSDAGAITVAAEAAIENLQYDKASRSVSYTLKGINYTPCSCTVSIPKALLQSPFTVTQGTKTVQTTTSQNETHHQITYSHTITDDAVKVAGSAPATDSPSPTQSPTDSATDTPQPSQPPSTQPSESSSPIQPSASAEATPSPQVPEINFYVLTVFLALAVLVIAFLVVKKTHAHRLFI